MRRTSALFVLLSMCSAPKAPREFMAWSTDGTKLLIYEPKPKRLVALAVPDLTEVWSLTGAEDAALSPAVHEMGFKVESLERRNRSKMSGPAGTTVRLEGESWLATVADRAPAFASLAATGYPTSTGRRAFVLPDGRLVDIVPVVELDLELGWHPMVAGASASYGSDDHPIAELNAVVSRTEARAMRRYGLALSGWLRKMQDGGSWREVGEPENGAGWVRGHFERGDSKIVVWILESGDDLIWISYIDRAWPSGQLERQLDRMARGARIRRSQ